MEHNNQQEGSTNNSQEEHVESLSGKIAIEKIREIANKAETCFFCTNIKTGIPFSVRPMAIQEVDDEGNIWFLSLDDSHKNDEIQRDPFTHLLMQSSAHSGFLNIYGISEVVDDRQKIEELWKPLMKTWFQGGKDDPHISLIRVTPTEGYYWDNRHGNVVAFLKMAVSTVIGKTMDDSVEGPLDV
ncbi:general stress protein [Pedobacter yulinensis]|uniref:General stress protein n=1 Tax=Pedobacter yulinensis TaxID=2126353 RepID=A0A2T3HN25_9SPHI|nr:pyridoxamine 5'-phosphate oxidase family protein [Pedobacter yulinensis]PST83862.1 general stress protein [Pedobacter yulinensis]